MADVARASGLDEVVFADTELSLVDGAAGRLVIRGHALEALAGTVPFEAVCGLLWHGELPGPESRRGLQAELARGRVAAGRLLPHLGDALAARDAMDALRAALGTLEADPERSHVAQAATLTGATAVFAAAWARARAGQTPVPPDPTRGHAADVWRMVHGRPPHPALEAALDTYLVTVADHGLNASTFTARVVASTGSDLVSAVVAAVGALKGPLHGGAPGPVLDMLDACAADGDPDRWLAAELDAGRRIMGMGHRVYRVRDPRAAVLEQAVVELAHAIDDVDVVSRITLARAVEAAAERQLRLRKPDRALPANVEFYTAVLLEALGLPRQAFSAIFAVGRVAGWCAHVEEQQRTGRLVRPQSRYVGPAASPAAVRSPAGAA